MVLICLFSWSFGPNWPAAGEIDIIEGVNDQNTNFMTLHTSPGCAIDSAGSASVQPTTEDCDTSVDGNAGCSFHDTDTTSYGTGFNNNGGGVFAMEWTSDGVSIWHFSHSNVPSDALGDAPVPSGWGAPVANWAGTGCDWDAHLMNHNL